MPFIGVTILPVAPGTSNSVAGIIISHLSRLYPGEAHEAYHVDHRLFVNTSSLLPGTSQKDRGFTQILTTSHEANVTYLTTLTSVSAAPATITIPTTSQDSFTQLLITKFQPLWAHRQSIAVDGVRMKLPLQDFGSWQISLGDLRVAAGGGRSVGAGNVGSSRGVLIEMQHVPSKGMSTQGNEDHIGQYETLFCDLLKSLLRNAGDYQADDIKFVVAETKDAQTSTGHDIGKAISKIYTELFRSSKA